MSDCLQKLLTNTCFFLTLSSANQHLSRRQKVIHIYSRPSRDWINNYNEGMAHKTAHLLRSALGSYDEQFCANFESIDEFSVDLIHFFFGRMDQIFRSFHTRDNDSNT